MIRREITFASGGETLVGEVMLPAGAPPHPAVLLIGGTMSDTRDGDPAGSLEGRLPAHGLLRLTAERLAEAGIGSLRWDKRGVGASSGGDRSEHSDVWSDVADAEQALSALSAASDIDPHRLAVLGESAGGYFACFLAARTDLPVAYVLQAALYSSIPDMLAFNYRRLADFCARDPVEAAWVKRMVPAAYAYSQHWTALIAAAQANAVVYEAEIEGEPHRWFLRRLRQELAYPPAEQFGFIKRPVLVIQGEHDLNVPPTDCHQIARTIRAAGNQAVTLAIVPNADHSMQQAAAEEEIRLRERISMESFRRPYVSAFFETLTGWLRTKLHVE